MNTTINHTNPRVRNIILAIAGSFFLQFAVKANTNVDPILQIPATNDLAGGNVILTGGTAGFPTWYLNTFYHVFRLSAQRNTEDGIATITPLSIDGYFGYVEIRTGLRLFQGDSANETTLISSAGNTYFNGGNVGIGTMSPAAKLHVSATDAEPMIIESSGANCYLTLKTNGGAGQIAAGGNGDLYFGGLSAANIMFRNNGYVERMRITPEGNVGIGTANPTHTLTVNGTIRAREIIVDTDWADYVFEAGYALQSLDSVEQHIKAEKHLPGIPSAREVAGKGVSLGDMQTLLLAKIEELTLHQIELNKRVKALEEENAALKTKQE